MCGSKRGTYVEAVEQLSGGLGEVVVAHTNDGNRATIGGVQHFFHGSRAVRSAIDHIDGEGVARRGPGVGNVGCGQEGGLRSVVETRVVLRGATGEGQDDIDRIGTLRVYVDENRSKDQYDGEAGREASRRVHGRQTGSARFCFACLEESSAFPLARIVKIRC